MKVSFLTGSRADAGALTAVEQALSRVGVTTGWFDIPIPVGQQDNRFGVANATALATGATAKYLSESQPDLVMIHGDRYEIMGAATAAFLMNLPIAHLGGGDMTEGSQDDSLRHAITKLSHIHFATCADSARRLIQLGERPNRVFNVGDPGIDVFYQSGNLMDRESVLKAVGLNIERYFLVAFHPNTVGDTADELETLVGALTRAQKNLPDIGIVLLNPNKDAGNSLIDQQFTRMVNEKVKYCKNLPRNVYLSALKHAIALVGNSSAAFYEAPSASTWIINIGDRQKGRETTANWLATVHTPDAAFSAMREAYLQETPPSYYNPYGDGFACDRIAKIILGLDIREVLKKTFYNLPCEGSCLTGFGKRYMLNGLGAGIPRKNLYGGVSGPMETPPIEGGYDSLISAAGQGPVVDF